MPDPTTQSNYLQVASEHIQLNWNVDYEARVISGSATHTMIAKENGVEEIILDTAGLAVESAEVDGKSAKHQLYPKHEVMGSALHIALPSALESGSTVTVKVTYKTTAASTALQWLEKEQTQGKTFPYLFSQCQPIYARSLTPCQDTPSVKIKYSANVTSVLPVLLSAIRQFPPSEGPPHDGKEIGKAAITYVYDQPVPIPSYLIAIACGNVRYRAFPKVEGKTWTCGIWAEPEMIDACYWEFSEDTGRFLAAEEEVVVPYKFGVYDLLVLPPSFPYGGMENACCTFLTPTLLAGDRSLVDVVVHELTHSWFGNGVTHAEATHFWLNEGWTTYIERLLQEKLHTPAHRGFSYVIGSKALYDALNDYTDRPKYQRLVIDFEHGEDPDDAYSSIAYEKGANFILHLEQVVGGLDVFLPYVKDYVNTFIGKSITTWQWKSHLYEYFAKVGDDKTKALDTVNWDAWLHGEGLELPVKMEYDLSLAETAYALAKRWDSSRGTTISQLDFNAKDLENFDTNQIIVFLERLQSYASLPSDHIKLLGDVYQLSATPNAEIRLRFYEVALSDPNSAAAKTFAQEAAKWVVGADGTGIIKGRMKFCRPVFKAVFGIDPKLAVSAFSEHKNSFHPIARKLLEKDLGLNL
ncbi:hypothetical protein FIBSPDRAFT_850643 [Athelia psychrophila]|uniref:Peptidase M1 leukotriene A4 hydrolase/aminopeptidase C-terminal domain-containing protein n=1 Tax=Athelia psychrophila TaxID=1759441 RepID=A0A166T8C2_9AGAM|nr:hypothetical protein FIBSPDRAFT_850643 [Fibularhizoctonia sp. CBS 109695]